MKFLLLILIGISVMTGYSQSKTYSFVFLHKQSTPAQLPKDQLEEIMQGHMANIERLAKEGKLIAAGPFEGGGGIFILNTTSLHEAKQWLSTDPGIQANRWDIEILPYTPRTGSVCLAQEPYEMVAYYFIRFVESQNPTTPNNADVLIQHHKFMDDLIKTDIVITEGTLERSGNILVMKDSLSNEKFQDNPAIKQGVLSLEIKKLWIAKGSFCE